MNEPMMAKQEYPPKLSVRIDEAVARVLEECGYKPSDAKDVREIIEHIVLLRQRVKKGENRKTAYAALNKSHLMTLLELRWLRAMVRGGDPVNWAMVLEQAKGSLWAIFRKEQTQDKNTPQAQIDKLATFILKEVPGEPSRSEGAVDTAIRLIKKSLNWHPPSEADAGDTMLAEVPGEPSQSEGAVVWFTEGTWAELKDKLRDAGVGGFMSSGVDGVDT